MMLEVMIDAAAGSLCLGLLLVAAFWLLRVRNPHLQRAAWGTLLFAALAMPLLMLLARSQPLVLPAVAGAAVIRSTTQAAARWQDVALYVYLGVTGMLLLRHCWALAQAYRLRRHALPHTAPWVESFDVRITARVGAPVSIGKTILLPPGCEDWSDEQLRGVIAHESSHIQRGDFLLMNLAQLHRALFWFSPLAWWLPRRLGLINEHLSDDAALAALEDRAGYARMLLEFTTAGQPNLAQGAANIAMARPATVSQRVERILAMAAIAPRPGKAATAALVTAVIAPALLIAAQAQVDIALDRAPKSNPYLPLEQPEYPAESRDAAEQGTVVLRLYVLVDGSVVDAQVKQSSGYPSLDTAAVQTARKWRLEPALANGQPVDAWGEFAISFKLTD